MKYWVWHNILWVNPLWNPLTWNQTNVKCKHNTWKHCSYVPINKLFYQTSVITIKFITLYWVIKNIPSPICPKIYQQSIVTICNRIRTRHYHFTADKRDRRKQTFLCKLNDNNDVRNLNCHQFVGPWSRGQCPLCTIQSIILLYVYWSKKAEKRFLCYSN